MGCNRKTSVNTLAQSDHNTLYNEFLAVLPHKVATRHCVNIASRGRLLFVPLGKVSTVGVVYEVGAEKICA